MGDTPIALGWRIHSWWAVVVAVTGPAASPTILHREQVTLVDHEPSREPYHAAVSVPLTEAPALIESIAATAAAAAETAMKGYVKTFGAVAAVGVVGGNRRLPDLPQILAKHARLHQAERDLYERAVIDGAARIGLPVTTVAATGRLFSEASDAVGVRLEPILAELGTSIGPPWQRNYKEATAAALVALAAAR